MINIVFTLILLAILAAAFAVVRSNVKLRKTISPERKIDLRVGTDSTIKFRQNEEGNIRIDIVREDDGTIHPGCYKTEEQIRREAEEFGEYNPQTEYFSRKDSDDLDHILVLGFDRQVALVEKAHRTGNIDDVAYENLKAKIEETSHRTWPSNPPGAVQFAGPLDPKPSPAPESSEQASENGGSSQPSQHFSKTANSTPRQEDTEQPLLFGKEQYQEAEQETGLELEHKQEPEPEPEPELPKRPDTVRVGTRRPADSDTSEHHSSERHSAAPSSDSDKTGGLDKSDGDSLYNRAFSFDI